jgi:hypothetical protein
MRLVDKKIQNDTFLKALAGALWKKPAEIRAELKRWSNRFSLQMTYVEAIYKIEGKTYTVYDLFIDDVWESNQKDEKILSNHITNA